MPLNPWFITIARNYRLLRVFSSRLDVCISLPFGSRLSPGKCGIFKGFFLVALFNFQGAVYIRRGISLRFGAFFFSEVFVVSLRDSLFIIAHFLSFVNPFSKIFFEFFSRFFQSNKCSFCSSELSFRSSSFKTLSGTSTVSFLSKRFQLLLQKPLHSFRRSFFLRSFSLFNVLSVARSLAATRI